MNADTANETRICRLCGVEFHTTKVYHRMICKRCKYKQDKVYRINNKDIIKERSHGKYIRLKTKHPERIKAQSKKYRDNNKEKIKLIKRKSYVKRYKENPEKVLMPAIIWKKKNPEKAKEIQRKSKEKKYLKVKDDPTYKVNRSLAKSIHRVLKNNGGSKDGRHWEHLVGYSATELKAHLEIQFAEGMSWDNYGEWHIDHIIPKSAFNFNAAGQIDFIKCWALENLRPLWAVDNIKKGARLQHDFQPSLAL